MRGSIQQLTSFVTMAMADNEGIRHIVLISAAYYLHNNNADDLADGIMLSLPQKENCNE